jgi:hypothetical protein
MATDENVVEFPKDKQEHPEQMQLYRAKIKTSEGNMGMIIQASCIKHVFEAVMDALPEGSTVHAVAIIHMGKPGES